MAETRKRIYIMFLAGLLIGMLGVVGCSKTAPKDTDYPASIGGLDPMGTTSMTSDPYNYFNINPEEVATEDDHEKKAKRRLWVANKAYKNIRENFSKNDSNSDDVAGFYRIAYYWRKTAKDYLDDGEEKDRLVKGFEKILDESRARYEELTSK